MQVHTREAIKRKALIPICNCFSISTGLLTGLKSGDTLSLQSLSPGLRAHRVSSFFPSPPSRMRFVTSLRDDVCTRGEPPLTTTVRRRGDPRAPREPLPRTYKQGAPRLEAEAKRGRRGRRRASTYAVSRSDTAARVSRVSTYPPHRGSFMFFPTRPDSYAESSYAHHAAAAIFRASTQFFRTTLARHRLSRFRTSKPIDGVSRESIRNRTS